VRRADRVLQHIGVVGNAVDGENLRAFGEPGLESRAVPDELGRRPSSSIYSKPSPISCHNLLFADDSIACMSTLARALWILARVF
jgi:hypothetical protein